jgi:hypothetical protein
MYFTHTLYISFGKSRVHSQIMLDGHITILIVHCKLRASSKDSYTRTYSLNGRGRRGIIIIILFFL